MNNLSKPKVVIFDIDGTLANVDHRRHFVEGPKKDFEAFYDAMGDDTAYEDIIELTYLLRNSNRSIFICTGRPFDYFDITSQWLATNGVSYDALYMRPTDKKYDSDYSVKRSMLNQIQKLFNVVMAIDDRDQVVRMWRENGIRCLQVADGNF